MALKHKPSTIGTAVMGLLSICFLAVIFTHQELVKAIGFEGRNGGIAVLFPIAMVLIYTYIHANFSHNVFTLLGIEARNKGGK